MYSNNLKLKYSDISDSTIDMSFNDLVNVKNPINPQDAVPKSYVDALTTPPTSYPEINVVLNNTTPIVFYGALTGIFTFVIQSTDPYGPKAKFTVAKNDQTKIGNIQRTINSSGQTGEQLQIIWGINSGISVFKTNNGYNGIYTINIIDTTINNVTIPTVSFTLSGTNETSISGDLIGLHSIKVVTSIPGGPLATFECAKSDANLPASINTIVNSTTVTSETLSLTWNSNSGITIKKSGNNYNGVYTAYFIF